MIFEVFFCLRYLPTNTAKRRETGLDFIWDLKKKGSKFTDGEILDPEHGRVYDAELWLKNGKLIVRGEMLIFGRNQTWPPAMESDFPADFKKPDLTQMVPALPDVY